MTAISVTPDSWKQAFFEAVAVDAHATELRDAALNRQGKRWTEALTHIVVETCRRVGWRAAAKGHLFTELPEQRNEYMGIDVMGFPVGEQRWRFPVAAIELENSPREDRIAYSLWKVLALRVDLRAVYCYRPEPEDGPKLVKFLRDTVVGALSVEEVMAVGGEALVVVGYRNNAETFPYGFFRWWRLNRNTRTFDLLN